MTIVTKNSLTLSNVNDGTITHTAYAYSADGNKGFTTVYPNLNLLEGSTKYTKDNPLIVSSSATDGWSLVPDVFVKNLKAGTYTMSGKADAPWTNHGWGDHNGKVGLWLVSTTPGLNVNINLGDTVPKTIEVPKDGDYCVRYNLYSNGTDVVTHKFWDFKLEQGSIATPQMPSINEVKTSDYPSYRGEYLDFSSTTSTDPSKYSWGLIKGSNSYTHTAYSWSADGKDGFTTVYPNLNLLTDSKDFKNKDVPESQLTTSITSIASTILKEGNDTYLKFIKSNQNQDWFRAYLNMRTKSPNFPNVDIKGNTNYTFSVWLKGTGTHTLIAYDSWTNPINARTDFTLTSDWKLYTFTVQSRPTADLPADKMIQFFIRSGTMGSEINLKYPKVEEGSVATPYMPSSSEVKTSDYPSYIGTYSDNNVESSSDYSKYQWAIFKGQNSNAYTAYSWSSDGTDRFTTTYPNLNLLDGSSQPFIMGYGIPNTTWDTTNQVSGISLPLTSIYDEVLPKGTGFPYMYNSGVTYTQSIYISTDAPLTGTPIKFTWFTGKYGHNTSGVDNLVKVSGNVYRATSTYTWPSSNSSDTNGRNADFMNLTKVFDFTKGTFLKFYKPKLELGSIVTPHMPSESEAQEQWQDAIPMYIGVGEKDSQNPSDYRWQLNPRYVQASSDSGLSNKAGVDDLASVADTANDALVQAQNAVSNEDYTSWLEHDYQSTINNLQDVSTKNQEDIKNVDDRTTIVEGFYGGMKVKWNFIDESFSFSEEGMFISNAQSKMSIQITSDKIVFWDNNVDVAFITGEVLNIQKGVFLESATIGNHLITKFSDDSPVTIIRYVGGIT